MLPPARPAGDVVAIVPLKALPHVKGRLAGALGAHQRRELATWMALRVLAACAEATCINRVLLVAGDEAAAAVGHRAGVEVLIVSEPGLGVALDAADAVVAGARASVIVAADLPLVRGGDLDAVCAALSGDGIVVAPTRDGGTGALLRRPPGVIPTAYGPGSARAHMAAAGAAGVEARTIDRSALSLDVDTPGALAEVASHLPLPPAVVSAAARP